MPETTITGTIPNRSDSKAFALYCAAVQTAFANGARIQIKAAILKADIWDTTYNPHWDWSRSVYRIAPEPPKPNFRPWEIDDIQVGKVVQRESDGFRQLITAVDRNERRGAILLASGSWVSPLELFQKYRGVDESICGTEVPC